MRLVPKWSRSNKIKSSYTKPTIGNVIKVFASFKPSKSMKLETSTRKCLMNTKSMSVEKPEVDKVDDDIVEVGEIEIMSDLDLVEVATLDYKLPGYNLHIVG